MNDQISTFLGTRVEANDFPSAVYLVAERGEVKLTGAVGDAVVEPETISADAGTIYDLASLTKPLVTGLLAAMLIDRGVLVPDTRIATLLNEFEIVGKRTITVRDLLTHTSHLPAWKPLYLFVSDPIDVLAEIAATDLEFGENGVLYSDLNFIVLAKLIERITEKGLDQLAAEEIFGPLGLRLTDFNPPRAWQRQIAASELGNVYEKQTCIERGDLDPVDAGKHFRDYQIWGEVHDGNAWFMGGVAGHAGLFSTVEEVAKIAWQFLPAHSSLLKSSTCDLFRTNFTAKTNEDRSFAFQLASTPGSTAGELMSLEGFGHTGFTGTSLWIDPLRERVFVLLTNRTHHHDLPFININSVRRRFHDLGNEHLDRNF